MASENLTEDEKRALERRAMERAEDRRVNRRLGLEAAPGSMEAFNRRERERAIRDRQFEADEAARIAGGWSSWTVGEKIKDVNKAVRANIQHFDRLYEAVRDVRKIGGDFTRALADYNAFCIYYFDITDDLKQAKESAYANDRTTRILMDTRSRIISRLIDRNTKYPVMVHDFKAFPRRLSKRGRDRGMDINQVPNNAYEINPLGFPQALGLQSQGSSLFNVHAQGRPRIDSDLASSPRHIWSNRVSPKVEVGKKTIFSNEITVTQTDAPKPTYGKFDYASLIQRGYAFRDQLGDEKFEDIMARYILALQTGDIQAATDMENYYNSKTPKLEVAGIFAIYKKQWMDGRYADFSDPATYGGRALPPDLEIRGSRVVLTWNIGDKTPPPPPSNELKAPGTVEKQPAPRINQQAKKREVKGGNEPPGPKIQRSESGGSTSSTDMPVDDGTFLLEKLNLKY